MSNHRCRGCFGSNIFKFYSLDNVPVHSVMLADSKQDALNFPKGNILLGFCLNCGLISNLSFDPMNMEYSSGYESTQVYSDTFNQFHVELAEDLIERFGLHNKTIIEIGCGNGEFLALLCELGGNTGIGFDPAFEDQDHQRLRSSNLTIIKDFYSEKYNQYKADFFCCKMTLEHIASPIELIKSIRHAIRQDYQTTVFFQVPDVIRILEEIAFWDIYYEHCSYFDRSSLAGLFKRCGFNVSNVWKAYEDQYLMIECQPDTEGVVQDEISSADIERINRAVRNFQNGCNESIVKWKSKIRDLYLGGKKTILWGGGSKAVSFLTTLKIMDEIKYVVDINPRKQGTYIAGTGQEIVSPAFLRNYEPETVIIMNNVYFDEIKNKLGQIHLSPELLCV
jgi:SAM-dependent methyltransferase